MRLRRFSGYGSVTDRPARRFVHGSRALYFGSYKLVQDRYKVERAADGPGLLHAMLRQLGLSERDLR